MIPLGQEQRLGRKTFLLLFFKRTTVALVLLFVALILGMGKDIVAEGLVGLVTAMGSHASTLAPTISSYVSGVALVFLLLSVVLFAFGYAMSRLEHVNYTFTMEEFDLKLKRGILNIKEVSIPYRQIQSVDITRPIAYQLFGVSRLVMITAGHDDKKDGHDETDTVFDPIDTDLAEEIRLMLQRKIGVQVIQGTTQADVDARSSQSAKDVL